MNENLLSYSSDDKATVKKDISYNDLNKIILTGSYYGTHLKNSPNDSLEFIHLYVTRHTNDWIVQQAIMENDDIYLRAMQGGIWYAWELVNFHECETDKTITIKIEEKAINHPLATDVNNGYMSASDKHKLDRVEDYANFYEHPLSHSPSIIEENDEKQFVSKAQVDDWNSKAAGDHIHQDYLNRFEMFDTSIQAVNALIDDLTKRITTLENKLAAVTNTVNEHVEDIPE